MTNELRECTALLERYRDSYLKNHQTERALITQVIERARAALLPTTISDGGNIPADISQSAQKSKRKKKA